jgi:hypothetical protein
MLGDERRPEDSGPGEPANDAPSTHQAPTESRTGEFEGEFEDEFEGEFESELEDEGEEFLG